VQYFQFGIITKNDILSIVYVTIISGIVMDLAAEKAKLLKQLDQHIVDKRVIRAMTKVPREAFMPAEKQYLAYEDMPLPIGFEQTISQPYIVGLMTEALELDGTQKVLEIGTGSGYQTAILAELARFVVTTERVSELSGRAKTILDSLGYTNIEAHLTGETLGWAEGAPYDAIVVTAGSPAIPDELLEQLAFGGRLVIPVGSRYEQELCKITKQKGRNIIKYLGGCYFVPLISKEAWKE
jgi:protein-L-isoaspartate(D-aspartate) O-methyltransferase